jgi:hypothetical protein
VAVTAVIQSPWLFGSDAIELSGGAWRKRVLPIGRIDYKGRTLTFDRPYLDALAASYNGGAYDQVPFQLANDKNEHTNDPERYRGFVRNMTVDDSGLWAEIITTEAGNTLLSANPNLGVSARIVEDYARADGQHFPQAIQHVLGTLDPRITSLGPWLPVDMAGERPDMFIDLSGASYSGEPGWTADLAAADDSDLDSLTPAGREIHRKLKNKGISHKVAMALAKRAQRVKPGKSAVNMATELDDALDLALMQGAASHGRDMLRQAEDAADAGHRWRSDHDILARALDRAGRGTYVAPSAAVGTCDCAGGMPTRYHNLDCDEAALSPDAMAEISGELREYARQPAADANGNYYANDYGLPATLTEMLQGYTGQRLVNADGPWETGRAAAAPVTAQRVMRFGDPEAPGAAADEMTGAAAGHVQRLADALFGSDSSAARQRQNEAERAQARKHVQAASQMRRYGSLGEAMDYNPVERQAASQPPPVVLQAGSQEFSNRYGDDEAGEPSWAPSAIGLHGALSW